MTRRIADAVPPDPEQAAELLTGLTEDARVMGMTVHAALPVPGGGGLLLHGPHRGGGLILSVADEWCDVTASGLPPDTVRALRDALTVWLDAGEGGTRG